jgi:hypothetical protein
MRQQIYQHLSATIVDVNLTPNPTSAYPLPLQDRDAKVSAVSELIEKNLRLLGCTAIEDKLQVGGGVRGKGGCSCSM